MEHEILTDFVGKLSGFLEQGETAMLGRLNLTMEIYDKLTSTEDGRKKLEAVFAKKPEIKPDFARLDMLVKIHRRVQEEYNLYLPF